VYNNITELGPREAEFVSLIAAHQNKIITMKDAAQFWGNERLARKKLSLLEKKGWVARIERGKYLVIPLEAGPERLWSESPYFIVNLLAKSACIAYWSAVHYWNWTEQIPRITYVQTTQRKSKSQKVVMGHLFEFVTVPPKKFFGCVQQWQGEISFRVTDKEKTLIDCADDVRRSGGIEELAKAVKAAVFEIDFFQLDEYALRFPNKAAMKRLGYLFETLVSDLPEETIHILNKWQKRLSAGINPLYPGGTKKGKINTRWRLLINVSI